MADIERVEDAAAAPPREPAEGPDSRAEVHEVLESQGKPSQAEGEDPEADIVAVLDPSPATGQD